MDRIFEKITEYLDGIEILKVEYVVAAMYHFTNVADPASFRPRLTSLLEADDIRGNLLLSCEGINGTVSGTRQSIDKLLSFLRSQPGFENLEHKESFANGHVFHRRNVKLKKEIVTLGVPGADPRKVVGTYVQPSEWNTLISDPSVVTIDTRNDYETAIGTFHGAVDPSTKNFREFPKWVDSNLDPKTTPKVAMFCTGGIRCEKATSMLKQKGFDEVFHLKGGILKYLEQIPKESSLWQGECYVFDNRVSVTHDLRPSEEYVSCFACRRPLSKHDQSLPSFEEGVSCGFCINEKTAKSKQRAKSRQQQIKLASNQRHKHMGLT